MKAWVLLICCMLAGCVIPSRHQPVSPSSARITFDTIVLDENREPHGWYSAIRIIVRDGHVYAETTQDRRPLAFFSYTPEQIIQAVVDLHEWSTRPGITVCYKVNRIQYHYSVAGYSVSGLTGYHHIRELPESVQGLYRAALDQAVLDMVSRRKSPNKARDGDEE